MTNKLNRKDILLLLLYVPGCSNKKAEPIKGITRFMKLLFLLKTICHIDKNVRNYYNFTPYKLGPFADELYSDIEFLESLDFINIRTIEFLEESVVLEIDEIIYDLLSESSFSAFSPNAYSEYEYRLSDKGLAKAEEISKTITPRMKNAIVKIKQEFGSLPLVELLRFVYRKNPDMAKKSIRPDLMKL